MSAKSTHILQALPIFLTITVLATHVWYLASRGILDFLNSSNSLDAVALHSGAIPFLFCCLGILFLGGFQLFLILPIPWMLWRFIRGPSLSYFVALMFTHSETMSGASGNDSFSLFICSHLLISCSSEYYVLRGVGLYYQEGDLFASMVWGFSHGYLKANFSQGVNLFTGESRQCCGSSVQQDSSYLPSVDLYAYEDRVYGWGTVPN
ncbi:hypothetical protein Tco_0778143 [Tanacetum coccineum]